MARLTTKSVEAARALEARHEIPDEYLRGLYLIVQPTGSKSWAVRYRLGDRSRKHTIGSYPAFDLKHARDAAAKILRSVAEGHGPRPRGDVTGAVEQFLARHCRDYRPNPRKEAERRLRLYIVEPFGGRKLDAVTRADIRAVLNRIEAPVAANRAHAIIRVFFNWAVANDLLLASPVAGIEKPHQEQPRDRVLTDDQLRAVWRAADKIGYPFGSIVQVLTLTGQRRGEVAGMTRSEIVGDTWTLPRERVKNGRRHEVPLPRQARALLEGLPQIGADFVFTLSGDAPYATFHRAKAQLDELVDIEPWTLHDMRRTTASGLARLGVNLVVIEKILNHVSGSLAGIVGVYQRHEFAEEKRAALQQWADYVERLVLR
jgi:integrase